MNNRTRHNVTQRGQAMSEFVIAATFVLLPVFVFIPLLGKYIDFKHAAIQAARYQAWEYTVWYEDIDDRDILENFNSGHAGFRMPEKSVLTTQNESRVRLMSNVGNEVDDGSGSPSAIPVLLATDAGTPYVPRASWADHRGLPFFDGTLNMTEVDTDDDTPTITIFGVDVGSWLNYHCRHRADWFRCCRRHHQSARFVLAQ